MAGEPPKEPPKATDWEEEFFKEQGITDDAEKKAIRGRSTVLSLAPTWAAKVGVTAS